MLEIWCVRILRFVNQESGNLRYSLPKDHARFKIVTDKNVIMSEGGGRDKIRTILYIFKRCNFIIEFLN